MEIPAKINKGPQDYMENNVLTHCVTYQVDRRDNKEEQELNSDCKVSNTWKESNATLVGLTVGLNPLRKRMPLDQIECRSPALI